MPKRAPKRASPKPAKVAKRKDAYAGLCKALARCTKDKLIDVILEFARDDSRVHRDLEVRFGVEVVPEELVASTRRAIRDATAFDTRQIGRNFDYDTGAYSQVERNFARLVKLGQLTTAMDLALELMKQGSYQVEMSDEGNMTYDIEQCLDVVAAALKRCDLPAGHVVKWCVKMADQDRVKYLYSKELQELRRRFEKAVAGKSPE